ncbi:3-deoxy-manno-octulosonate cytidylyltransferase [Gammaproteobacteria bacterium]|nr:3-deoxy-manno-octulosonate cytidylyltransferase [Gammaproteobacteria bacterium]
MANFQIIIPIRLNSTRLAKKALIDICGKPLMWYVYQGALQSGASNVIITSDHPEILATAKQFGAKVCPSGDHHRTGSDRIAEVCQKMGFSDDQVVVNLQGDEPLVPKSVIDKIIAPFVDQPSLGMSTICTPIKTHEELKSDSCVKVVVNHQGNALYFSRAPIHYPRGGISSSYQIRQYRHLGIYGYRVGALKQWTQLPQPMIEQQESLEQLRALFYGHKIYVSIYDQPLCKSIDTQADLDQFKKIVETSDSKFDT